jgi:phosphoribosylformylglycinamidine synthase subunit PurS
MPGHSRSKNGVASLAYVPGIHVFYLPSCKQGVDGRDKPGQDGNGFAMKARVTVTLKSGILDPQGKAIEGALRSLGVGGVASVRQGKVFDIELQGADRAGAEAALKDAAEKLLANTVIENYRIEVTG